MKEIQVLGELRRDVRISDLIPGPNSRMEINEGHLDLLMQSMRAIGLLEPIGLVRKPDGRLETSYGFRRLAAAKKLGWTEISAVIRDQENDFDAGIQNLAENIQRRPVTMAEVGPFIQGLVEQGLNPKQIAVRVGATAKAVQDALNSIKRVPKSYQSKIQSPFKPSPDRMISPALAGKIDSARKTYKLGKTHTKKLFQLAEQHGPAFKGNSVSGYAKNIKAGKAWNADPDGVKNFSLFSVTNREYKRVVAKFVTTGQYRSFRHVIQAIVTGRLREKISIVERDDRGA